MCRHITVASIDRKTKRLYPIPSIPRSKAPCGEMRDVCGGDVLVYNKFIDGMPLVLVVPYGLKIGSVDSDMCVLRINKNKLDPRFLYHIISTLGFTHQLTKREQVTIDIAQLSRVIVPLVPIMLQGKAVEILDRFERSSIRQYDAWVKSVNMLLYAQCEAYWCRTDLGPFFSALGKDRTKKR